MPASAPVCPFQGKRLLERAKAGNDGRRWATVTAVEYGMLPASSIRHRCVNKVQALAATGRASRASRATGAVSTSSLIGFSLFSFLPLAMRLHSAPVCGKKKARRLEG